MQMMLEAKLLAFGRCGHDYITGAYVGYLARTLDELSPRAKRWRINTKMTTQVNS